MSVVLFVAYDRAWSFKTGSRTHLVSPSERDNVQKTLKDVVTQSALKQALITICKHAKRSAGKISTNVELRIVVHDAGLGLLVDSRRRRVCEL